MDSEVSEDAVRSLTLHVARVDLQDCLSVTTLPLDSGYCCIDVTSH